MPDPTMVDDDDPTMVDGEENLWFLDAQKYFILELMLPEKT